MRMLFIIFYILAILPAHSQSQTEKLAEVIKQFHQALVNRNFLLIKQLTQKDLTYGHSNGWVETKTELLKNIETGYIIYHSFKEDSLKMVINGKTAHVRFVADIAATLHGNSSVYHLKVLEVWVKKGKRWLLFARQAVKG